MLSVLVRSQWWADASVSICESPSTCREQTQPLGLRLSHASLTILPTILAMPVTKKNGHLSSRGSVL